MPGPTTGRSFAPLLNGELDASQADALHDAIFSEVSYHGFRQITRAIRTDRYKFIQSYDDQPISYHSCDASTSKNEMLDHGWGDQPLSEQQLYDLVFDPCEMNNLADQPDKAQVVQTLQSALEKWMADTHDPALQRQVPEPAETV